MRFTPARDGSHPADIVASGCTVPTARVCFTSDSESRREWERTSIWLAARGGLEPPTSAKRATAFPVKLPSGLKIAPRQVAARGMLAIVISSATLPILERSLLTSHIISDSIFGCQGKTLGKRIFLTCESSLSKNPLPLGQSYYNTPRTRLPTIIF